MMLEVWIGEPLVRSCSATLAPMSKITAAVDSGHLIER